jgi:hypothetical protein
MRLTGEQRRVLSSSVNGHVARLSHQIRGSDRMKLGGLTKLFLARPITLSFHSKISSPPFDPMYDGSVSINTSAQDAHKPRRIRSIFMLLSAPLTASAGHVS